MDVRLDLQPFPGEPPLAAQIVVSARRLPDAALQLSYTVASPATALRLPPPVVPGPADELWRHTCCELFVASAGGEASGYREFNFSPSGQWAIYEFSGYRQRAAESASPLTVDLHFAAETDGFVLTATLPPALLGPAPRRIGLSAVLEAEAGGLAYWALAHPGPRPDFHDSRAFTFFLDEPV